MLAAIVNLSVRLRYAMLALLVVLLGTGVYAALRLPIDAVPDISPVQVSVITSAPGLSAEQVERAVTFPIENALNGTPGLVELRSVSRGDTSAVTVIFEDGMDPWFVRQIILERIQQVLPELPEGVGPPELAPLSNGLGEIYQFVLTSKFHTPKQLRTILDWEVIPSLRNVPGVIEVNSFGGELKQYQVVVEPERLRAHELTIEDVAGAIRAASASASGGYVDRGAESYTLRAMALFQGLEDIEEVVIQAGVDQPPVLVRHVAEVQVGAALQHGVVTYQGEESAVTGIVMMLQGSNSREVVYAVKDRIAEIQAALPPGVMIETVYDRAEFVERALETVLKNLAEGVLIVTLVLPLMLGSLRGALAVVLAIPASAAVALLGMHAFGVTGDLMSLGAIDFGFLVDGPIVVLEALLAARITQHIRPELGPSERLRLRLAHMCEVMSTVMRPVFFSVAIIMLVYLPLLGLEGIEGKMFRPMAITMACALAGALVYSVLFLPAVLAVLNPEIAGHGPKWLVRIEHGYGRVVAHAIRWRWRLLGACTMALVAGTIMIAGAGADFVPRIEEGDAMVTIRRAPSISLAKARELDLEVQRKLREFPEVERTLAMSGRPELATDPVGKDNTDILVALAPRDQWTVVDFDELSVRFKTAAESVPGTFASVSQPIEDRTNELISGSRADVQIMLYGSDLFALTDLSEQIADIVSNIQGAGDVRVERVLGLPNITVEPNRAAMAMHGVSMQSLLDTIEAARVGLELGTVWDGQRRFDLRLLVPPRASDRDALGDLVVEGRRGTNVPLSELATVIESDGPANIRREDRVRTLRVEVNLRGRDLVSWVAEARAAVNAQVALPSDMQIAWGGQFENFERASARLSLIVPITLAIVFGMLMAMFQDARWAAAVFGVVPFAATGGIFGLAARDLPFSIPAAVGFVALAGVAVLNGVVLTSKVREAFLGGMSREQAIVSGSTETMRAVLTTGAVAALGFMPMALATSAGAEVQRPLATVVVFGIGLSTIVTLFVLPGILRICMPTAAPKRQD
ncbi:MAG: CusA/CzcA family heavy metal efflux RND transporter [Enhygromyxa sp.]